MSEPFFEKFKKKQSPIYQLWRLNPTCAFDQTRDARQFFSGCPYARSGPRDDPLLALGCWTDVVPFFRKTQEIKIITLMVVRV